VASLNYMKKPFHHEIIRNRRQKHEKYIRRISCFRPVVLS
jgi:hypothetical protein